MNYIINYLINNNIINNIFNKYVISNSKNIIFNIYEKLYEKSEIFLDMKEINKLIKRIIDEDKYKIDDNKFCFILTKFIDIPYNNTYKYDFLNNYKLNEEIYDSLDFENVIDNNNIFLSYIKKYIKKELLNSTFFKKSQLKIDIKIESYYNYNEILIHLNITNIDDKCEKYFENIMKKNNNLCENYPISPILFTNKIMSFFIENNQYNYLNNNINNIITNYKTNLKNKINSEILSNNNCKLINDEINDKYYFNKNALIKTTVKINEIIKKQVNYFIDNYTYKKHRYINIYCIAYVNNSYNISLLNKNNSPELQIFHLMHKDEITFNKNNLEIVFNNYMLSNIIHNKNHTYLVNFYIFDILINFIVYYYINIIYNLYKHDDFYVYKYKEPNEKELKNKLKGHMDEWNFELNEILIISNISLEY